MAGEEPETLSKTHAASDKDLACCLENQGFGVNGFRLPTID